MDINVPTGNNRLSIELHPIVQSTWAQTNRVYKIILIPIDLYPLHLRLTDHQKYMRSLRMASIPMNKRNKCSLLDSKT